MLQTLNEDISLSEWSILWRDGRNPLAQLYLDTRTVSLLIPCANLADCFLLGRVRQDRRVSDECWWCLAPTHSCLLKRPQAEYHVLCICYGFSIVLWWKVPVLQDRMSSSGVAPWWKELCLTGMGWGLGVWLWAHKMALTDSFSHWICDACRSLAHLFSAHPFLVLPVPALLSPLPI